MSRPIRIRKGANIRMNGRPAALLSEAPRSTVYAVSPPDFHGVVPKLVVQEGDAVEAGSELFFNKYRESVRFLSPVSGKVKTILRGAKRRILAIEITADATDTYRAFEPLNTAGSNREAILAAMQERGAFAFIKQRPFDVLADPAVTPRSIHISGFMSAPLSPEMSVIMEGRMKDFQAGVDALAQLAGPHGVHLGTAQGESTFAGVTGVKAQAFHGPHPAGNVGVQIHHTLPINAGETAWTLHAEDVANIGACLTTGKYIATRVIAGAGSEHPKPQHYRALTGAQVATLIAGAKVDDSTRLISGDPLTGTHVAADGYLGSLEHALCMLPEGREPKFLLTTGWLGAGFEKFSLSRAFPTWLMPKSKDFTLDTNSNGEERAFVVTGQYEQVFPFDLFPVHLVKSILVNDIDGMEKLGIYEVAPEDFALCEYSCTSKIDVQHIVREGLDMLQKELG
jgi:Na+-transporting NADH:ubiquinone oxidoreductase subunit A